MSTTETSVDHLNMLLEAQAHAEATVVSKDVEASTRILKEYFMAMRYAYADKSIDEKFLETSTKDWVHCLAILRRNSPATMFDIICGAFQSFEGGIDSKGDRYLLNIVSSIIANTAGVTWIKHIDMDGISLAESGRYALPLMNILRTLAPQTDSKEFDDTFFFTMSKFEDFLADVRIPPTLRYDYVRELRDWARENGHSLRLLERMDEILEYAEFHEDGQGYIRNDLQIQAEELGLASRLAIASAQPRNIKDAFCLRAGLPLKFQTYHTQIESHSKGERWNKVESSLVHLFRKIADEDDVDAQALSYWFKRACDLAEHSLDNGCNLATRCIDAIENDVIQSEHALLTVYGFALPVFSKMEKRDSEFIKAAKEYYKTMMKRSSEIDNISNADEVFKYAAESFCAYLVLLHPTERHDELFELSVWLKGRKHPCEPLGSFVDTLMNFEEGYGGRRGIPFEGDTAVPDRLLLSAPSNEIH